MNRPRALLVAVAAVMAACGTDSDTPPAEPSQDDAAANCDPELDDAFSAWAEAGFSGTVSISTGGEFDCLAGYGLADEATGRPNTVDTVFSIGSVSKSFTAAAIFDLVDEEKLSLDDRAGDILPDLVGPVADATVEQLLLHTSGLTGSHGRDHEPLERDAAVAAIGGLELAFEPGSDFLYSNAGYTLLALIVEATSGVTYRDYMTSQIMPLPGGDVAGGFWDGEPAAPGPRAVGYLDDGPTDEMGDFAGPHWATEGNGSLAMTTRDLATWTHALFTGQLVSPESVEAISRPGFDQGNGTSETPGWVAFDASILGEPGFAAAGGGGDVGHNVVVVWLPQSERVFAIASNGPDVSAEELLQAVGPALVASDPLPTPDARARAVDPAELEALAGTYDLETGGSFDVSARDDELGIAAAGADAVAALFPLSEDFSADEVKGHEQRVLALLAGETQQGREERAAFEGAHGPIEDVALAGTIVDDGELRTYATITTGTDSIAVWYAVNDEGGVMAAEILVEPPTLLLVPSDSGEYRPDDPTGSGPDVTVVFEAGRMTVTGPTLSATAQLAA